jgi:nitronate monooxygenase
MFSLLNQLIIGNLIVQWPIIQGGMGVGISLHRLAAAVANEGGVGVIAAADVGMDEKDFKKNPTAANIRAMRREIQLARSLTGGLLGVNIMVALTDFAELAKVAVEEGIDFIFSGAGLPLNLPEFLLEKSTTKLVPIVSSGRAAALIAKKWQRDYGYLPDAFVVEGPLAGGHLGFKVEQINDPKFALENLVPEVIAAIENYKKFNRPIPLIAAGGIFTGGDIRKILKLGAAGVQMGTRFVATYECDANEVFKQAYINAKEEDMVIMKSPVGLPGRSIGNDFLARVEKGEKLPVCCPYQCLKTCDPKIAPYCISLALINAKKGKLKEGFAFCGANVGRIDKIISVHELFQSLLKETETAENV